VIENKEELRAKLELLKLRIEGKIQNIVFTHKKLPFDRLSKGRRLKELVIMALAALYNDDQLKLDEYIRELREKGIKILK
jgi:hypothetical protein